MNKKDIEYLKKKNKRYKEKFELLKLKKGFDTKVKFLREYFSIPDNGFSNFKEIISWNKKNKNKIPELLSECNKLRKIYKKDKRWRDLIRYYVLTNEYGGMRVIPWICKKENFDDPYEEEINMSLSKDTTKEDIEFSRKHLFEPLKKDLVYDDNIKFQPTKNISIKKKIAKLKHNGYSIREIQKIINNLSSKKIYGYEEINNIYSRIQ